MAIKNMDMGINMNIKQIAIIKIDNSNDMYYVTEQTVYGDIVWNEEFDSLLSAQAFAKRLGYTATLDLLQK